MEMEKKMKMMVKILNLEIQNNLKKLLEKCLEVN